MTRPALKSAGCSAAALNALTIGQGVPRVAPRCPERRKHADDRGREQRNGQRKSEHAHVHADLSRPRQLRPCPVRAALQRPRSRARRPNPAPATVRTRDSTMNLRATRAGPAPRARRKADSRSRESARASMRFATFTQATSSSAPDATSRTVNAARTLPASCSITGRTEASTMLAPSPYCCLSRSAIALRSCWAAATDTSSRKRPTT